ncbi:PepSY domain-containing protein [Streptomyces anulatus]
MPSSQLQEDCPSAAVSARIGVPAMAVESGNANQSTWIDRDTFQSDLKSQGMKINKFKITKGNTYQVEGLDKEGRKIKADYDPVTGKSVRTEYLD